jgi:uncharacterized membrane protein YkvA (DUF1232 family)
MQNQEKEPSNMNVENALAVENRDPGFFREKWQQLRLVYRLLRDPEVPVFLKAIPFISVVYFLVPTDVLPDIMVGLGQLDDLTVMFFGAKFFIDLAPVHLVTKHLDEIRAEDGYGAVSDVDDSIEGKIIIDGDHEGLPK